MSHSSYYHYHHNHHLNHNQTHEPIRSSTHPPFLKVIIAGKGKTIASNHVVEKVQQLSNKKRPNVAYFGTACKDRESQYKALAIPYEDVGCHVFKVDLWNFEQQQQQGEQEEEVNENEKIRQRVSDIIHRADVILFSGGSKDIAMKKWAQYGIDEMFIHAAYRTNPPIFVGGSAGALCLAHTGLQLLPLAVVPHFDTLSTHRVAPPHRILAKHPHITCIGLDENAAWFIHGYETFVLSSSSLTLSHHPHKQQDDATDDDTASSSTSSCSCYHVYYKNGRLESSSLPLNEMIPLSSFGISIGPTS